VLCHVVPCHAVQLTCPKLLPPKLPAHIHPDRITASTTISAAAGASTGAVLITADATTTSGWSKVTLLLVSVTSPRLDTRGAATRARLCHLKTSIIGLRLAAVAGPLGIDCCCCCCGCCGEVRGEVRACCCCCCCCRWCCQSVCCSAWRLGVAGMMMHTWAPSGCCSSTS